MLHLIWVVIIGAIAGFIAKWISPSPNNPEGSILTTILGIVGSVPFQMQTADRPKS